jgi:hypothetical protein
MEKYYENYPASTVALTNFVALFIDIIGALVMYQFGLVPLILYLIYIVYMEVRLLSHCAGCYYYGKTCAFGRGRISGLIFRKKKSFVKKITWKDMIPDFLVSIIPIAAGIISLIINFNWLILAAVIALVLLTSTGNACARSRSCKHCKQRKLGCPADKLFNKKKGKPR